jgi:hypothetical protein
MMESHLSIMLNIAKGDGAGKNEDNRKNHIFPIFA